MTPLATAELLGNATVPHEGGETPWPALIERIQANDTEGMEDLYHVFCHGVRYYLYRQLAHQDLEDTLHDTFLVVTQAIQRGELREPERLMGFVWTVVRRHLAGQIERSVIRRNQQTEVDGAVRILDHNLDPESAAIVKERQVMAYRLLNEVPERDREILMRFYLQEQSQEEICREMELTDTQFRLLKSRAKGRFAALAQKRLARGRLILRRQGAGTESGAAGNRPAAPSQQHRATELRKVGPGLRKWHAGGNLGETGTSGSGLAKVA